MATAPTRPKIGPADRGRSMSLAEFVEADTEGGYLYELARGVVQVTEIPGTPHGWIVPRVARLFDKYGEAHPGVIRYLGGGGESRLRLPGMVSDRHPDQAIYLSNPPRGKRIWTRWVPDIVVEVVGRGGEDRDFIEKREEYLRVGVREYWVIDRFARKMHAFARLGDTWEETILGEDAVHRTHLLPGLEAHVGILIGPPVDEDDEEADDGGEAGD